MDANTSAKVKAALKRNNRKRLQHPSDSTRSITVCSVTRIGWGFREEGGGTAFMRFDKMTQAQGERILQELL